jgi:hypothetical protein
MNIQIYRRISCAFTQLVKHLIKITLLLSVVIFSISLFAVESNDKCKCCEHLIPKGAVLADGKNVSVNEKFSNEEMKLWLENKVWCQNYIF